MVEQSAGSRRAYAALERRAEQAERRAEAAEARVRAAEARAEEAERMLEALRSGGEGERHREAKDEPTYRSTMFAFSKRLEAVEQRLLAVETGQQCQIAAQSAPCQPEGEADLLYGVPAIAAFLGLKVPQARHLSDRGQIPTFKLPGNRNTCARRSALAAWLAAQEGR